MPSVLFLIVTLTWGLTWYAIHLQLGLTPDAVSIFLRFAVAAGCMWLGLIATRRVRGATVQQHAWFAVMGLTLFSGNFLLLYAAEHDVPSGLVSVVFSMATLFNAVNQWVFRSIRPSRRILLGAFLGIAGVICLFADQITAPGGGHYLRGIGLALGGTYAFSLGNLASGRATADGTTLGNAIARGMSWGVLILATVILLQGHSFLPHVSAAYLWGLAYLALIGSVVGFLAYLSLVARIGPARAAYATVVTPVVALVISALLEGYVWKPFALAGISMVLMGNLVMFVPITAGSHLSIGICVRNLFRSGDTKKDG
jgi:drug/metabolite transporter (DMT)-like permease